MQKYLFIKGFLLPVLLLLIQQPTVFGQQNWQWRGENRNGMYLNETGLLKEWPADGPRLLWHFDGLGEGFTSVSIASEKIYITGMHDDRLILYVFDMSGKLLHDKVIGKEWNINHNGTRSSVCVNDGKLYIFNALGTLFCLDEVTLNEVWKKDLINELGGRNLKFGMAENPLIVGEKILMTPGGEINNMVALNKRTGALIWSSQGEGTLSAYCSPIYIEDYDVPMVVTATQLHLIAFHADTGEKIWSHPQKNPPGQHPNIPIYHNGMIFSTTGSSGGSMLLRLSDDRKTVEQIWKNNVDNQIGSAIKVGDYVYTSGQNSNRGWFCMEWNTGEIMYQVNESGCNVIFADEMLYVYSDRGVMSLVKPNSDKYELISSFEVKLGTGVHFAHPVIHQGVMYIRHGDTLMAYQVK